MTLKVIIKSQYNFNLNLQDLKIWPMKVKKRKKIQGTS